MVEKSTRVVALGSAFTPRSGHSAVCDRGVILVFGGFDGSNVLNDLFRFTTEDDTWEKIEPSEIFWPKPRTSHGACLDTDH